MKVLFSMLLIFIGLFGAPIAFMSHITIKSSVSFIDGAELSKWLGILAIFIVVNGLYVVISDISSSR